MKTLAELLHDHIDYWRSLNYSRWTIRQGYYCAKRFVDWLQESEGITSAEKIRTSHLQKWLKHLSKLTTSKGRPVKARTVNKHIETVKGFMKYLVRNDHIQKRLAEMLEYVKEPKVLPGSVLIHKQVQRMIAQVDESTSDGYRDRTMLELLYSTGIRASELLGLNTNSIDYLNGTVLVHGKGNKERVVPVGKTALKYVETYTKAVRPYLLSSSEEPALFLDMEGRRFPYFTLRRIVHMYAKKAGLDINVTPHTFRRSCTTELLRAGAGMYHVKEMLGHESLDTLKHYAKLTITDLKRTHRKCHPRERDQERADAD